MKEKKALLKRLKRKAAVLSPKQNVLRCPHLSWLHCICSRWGKLNQAHTVRLWRGLGWAGWWWQAHSRSSAWNGTARMCYYCSQIWELPANSLSLHWWPTWSWWAPELWAPASATGRWEPPSPSSAEATPLASGCPANLLGRAKRQLNPTMTAVRRRAPVALQIPPRVSTKSRNTAMTDNCPIWQKL